MSDGLAPS